MSIGTTAEQSGVIRKFRSPKSLIGRFIAKRTLKSSTILGSVLGLYMLSKAYSYLKAYPTEVARQKIAETLGNNVGIEALLGVAHHIDTVAGYVTWNFLCLMAAVGAIWALLIATKTFRGEEDSGRWELLVAGQTTERRAAANALIGLGSGLIVVYALVTVGVLAIGRLHGADLTISASLFFSMALVAGAAEFLAVGALASQLMPVRSRATGLSMAVFGVFYMIRLAADTTTAHWLLNVSPLGWIERLQPMYASQPIWLLPIGGFVALLCGLTIFFAGRRDLGEGVLADKSIAKPRTRLLGSPFTSAIRLTRGVTLNWLAAIILFAFVYGQLAKGSIVKALSQSSAASTGYNRLAQTSHEQSLTVAAFLGITFLIIMIVTMFYAASSVGKMREDEAQGYLDNFLVRPISRIQWLRGRVFLIVVVIILAGLLSGLATWVGQASQQGGVSLHSLLLAGANTIAPALLILGIGIFVYGIAPRLFGFLTYGAIAWSFLVIMLSSGLTLNHWLLDTSILHHVSFAPAVNANWTTNLVMLVIAVLLGITGTLAFNERDLEPE